jgi:hypothetical protein
LSLRPPLLRVIRRLPSERVALSNAGRHPIILANSGHVNVVEPCKRERHDVGTTVATGLHRTTLH